MRLPRKVKVSTAIIEVVCQVLSVKTYQCDPLDVLAKPFDLSV